MWKWHYRVNVRTPFVTNFFENFHSKNICLKHCYWSIFVEISMLLAIPDKSLLHTIFIYRWSRWIPGVTLHRSQPFPQQLRSFSLLPLVQGLFLPLLYAAMPPLIVLLPHWKNLSDWRHSAEKCDDLWLQKDFVYNGRFQKLSKSGDRAEQGRRCLNIESWIWIWYQQIKTTSVQHQWWMN